MNPLKTLNLYKGSLLSRQGTNRLLRALLSLKERKGKIPFQTLGLRLNMRPYNRLDKEVADFRECKEELVTQHNTKCSYYRNGQNKDRNEYKMYIQHQILNEHHKTIIYLLQYTLSKRTAVKIKDSPVQYKPTPLSNNENIETTLFH